MFSPAMSSGTNAASLTAQSGIVSIVVAVMVIIAAFVLVAVITSVVAASITIGDVGFILVLAVAVAVVVNWTV